MRYSRGVELQATLALQRGDELGARQIVGRKIGALKTRDALEVELAEASGLSARLVAGRIRMEDRAQLARRKRDELLRRRRTAEAERRSRHSHPRSGSGAFDGYAETVSALEIEAETTREYKSADGDGEKVFMLNMLPEIIEELAKTVDKVTVDRVSVIDAGGGGNGSGMSRFVNQFPAAVISLSEQIENATGVNILSSLNSGKAAPAPEARTDTSTR